MNKLNLEFIRERRQELDMSLQIMAECMGFKNASTYMKYEKGEYSFKADHLPKLAEILGCKIEFFFSSKFAKTAKNKEVS